MIDDGINTPPWATAVLADMIRARVWSTRVFNLQRQGRAGTNAPVDGAEALFVAAVHALDPATDWFVPQYREPPALARFGEEVLRRYVLYVLGHPGGSHYPEGVRVYPTQISLAAQVPHAVGLAWGMKLQGVPGVVTAVIGDGATSEGDFYEATNLAGVLKAPVIFLVNNNHWAISTPLSKQTAATTLAAKASGVGMPGVTVDGTDPVAVFEAVAEARALALDGGGPTMIEGVTYRLGPHTTADDPSRYVPDDELAEWQARDPVPTFESALVAAGVWTAEESAAVRSDADAVFDAALDWAEAQPVDTTDMLAHVLAEPTPRQRRQLSSLESDPNGNPSPLGSDSIVDARGSR